MVYGCAPRRTAQISLTRRKPGVIGLALTGLAILLLLVSLTTHPPPSFITATVVVVVPHSPPRLCRFRIVIAFELRSREAEPPRRCAPWVVCSVGRMQNPHMHKNAKEPRKTTHMVHVTRISLLSTACARRFFSEQRNVDMNVGEEASAKKAGGYWQRQSGNGSCRALVVSSSSFPSRLLHIDYASAGLRLIET